MPNPMKTSQNNIQMRSKLIFLIIYFIKLSVYSQTSGPSQPEVQSFQPVTMTNMVDPSSGEFKHQIPLFTIGGYPVNINYNSQVTMEQEASMVGLGWNLNVGAITRQVRGLPDDFKGDLVKRQVSMKPNITIGQGIGFSLELLGLSKKDSDSLNRQAGLSVNANVGIFFNNINGWGIDARVRPGFNGHFCGWAANAGIGISSNSQHGTNINPYVGLSKVWTKSKSVEIGQSKIEGEKLRIKSARIKVNGLSSSAGYDFLSSTFTPKLDLPFITKNYDYKVKAGYAFTMVNVGGERNFNKVVQKLSVNEVSNPAFGSLYADFGKDREDALMDFVREQDGIMMEDKPNLPFTFNTPDIYSVAGQGIGGVFELKRNNVFVAFDPFVKTNNNALGAEIDLGFGPTDGHIGAEIRGGYTRNTSSKWDGGSNRLLPNVDFNNLTGSLSEKVYFKNPSDVMFNANPIYQLSGIKPIAPILSHIPYWGGQTKESKINVEENELSITRDNFLNSNRDKRLDVIYYLNAKETQEKGFQQFISSYKLNEFSNGQVTYLPRVAPNRPENQLSEMICLKPDGQKYVFNIPAINNEKREFSYSINDNEVDNSYETNRVVNQFSATFDGGKDGYLSVTHTPAYAHAFLLGSVLSPNYIDVDANGPSVNDLGDYVKFNYSLLDSNFYWRSNNSLEKVGADKGNVADERDAKAFYSEGTKEIWLIHSIESKNEVARFYYSNREDAFDLKDPNKKLQKLDSILIFSMAELNKPIPMPLKKVYFQYDDANPLCKGIFNNNSLGKLTLNKVYFKEGSSHKGKHSAYEFGYGFNKPYDELSVDRWGNYKTNSNLPISLDNKKFPYVLQDNPTVTNQSAATWLLNSIKLPSGGKITINYEAHDYAYVQNKRAMYMTPIVSVVKEKPNTVITENTLYTGNTPHNYLIFKLKTPFVGTLSEIEAKEKLKVEYLTDPTDSKYGAILDNPHANFYGKFYLNVDRGFSKYEEIPAFLDIKECGVIKDGNQYNYGWIELKGAPIADGNNDNANQISKIGWEFVKHTYPHQLFGLDEQVGVGEDTDVDAMITLFENIPDMIKGIIEFGPYRKLRNDNIAQKIDLEKSFIRLYEPAYRKIGGSGARVQKITVSDHWDNMTGTSATASAYSIVYDYSKTENGKIISSGVASYEPEVGEDENPWYQPIHFKEKNVLQPDDNKFLTGPIGKSLFPSASIVYSNVKVTQNPVVNQQTEEGAGNTIYEFYTARDFPIQELETKKETKRVPKLKLTPMFGISNDYMATVMGYSIVSNDMHGKPKSESIYGEGNNLVSQKKYFYKSNSDAVLINEVPSIDETGNISTNQTLGVETLLTGDARRFDTESYSGSLHGNLDLSWKPPFFGIPTFVPDFSFEKKSFSSFTLTKHIRQQGILDSVVVTDKGSTIATKNLLWDAKTGAVLLTQTTNEFKDPIYNFSYPAHWAYVGMGMACENIGTEVSSIVIPPNNSLIQVPGIHPYFTEGDIVFVEKDGQEGKKMVIEKIDFQNSSFTNLTVRPFHLPIQNPAFNLTNYNSGKLKIIQSGKRNVATTSIGSLVLLKNPIVNNRLQIDQAKQIIDANAVVFDNKTKDIDCDTCSYNQHKFIQKLTSVKNLGAWQPVATYKFVDDRTQTVNNPVLRTDGAIKNFVPFWNRVNSGRWLGFTNQGVTNYNLWIAPEKVTMVDAESQPLESKNAIGIYSSVSFSNFDGMVNATTANARYHEMLFDGFEDYMPCPDDNHYTLLSSQYPTFRSNEQAHTGNYSMKTGATDFTKIIKNANVAYDCEKEVEVVEGQFNQEIQLASRPLSPKCDCEPEFQLQPNKEYILSLWVREANASNNAIDYQNANVKITMGSGNTASITARPEGQILDGWQRIEKRFTTPATNTQIKLTFSPNTYFDDVRIHPADANMKSYVYDERDYSLMATLDENNFATFYEYNNEKNLKRVKKETEKSVVTLQEVNFGAAKK